MKNRIALALAAICIAGPAAAFDVEFTWDGLELCTSGKPNRVANPEFVLNDVPEGTKYLRFKMVDLDVPNYNHGGGVVKYSGQTTIARGAFKYKSPCPPNGTHRYQWRVTAQTKKNGGKIATARSTRDYP